MVKIIKGKYKRIPKQFSRHLSDMVHWLLTKNPKKRPSITDIILDKFFQKKAVQLRIPLPIRPKEIILPGDSLKVTGGCFDSEDFNLTGKLNIEQKSDNQKKSTTNPVSNRSSKQKSKYIDDIKPKEEIREEEKEEIKEVPKNNSKKRVKSKQKE